VNKVELVSRESGGGVRIEAIRSEDAASAACPLSIFHPYWVVPCRRGVPYHSLIIARYWYNSDAGLHICLDPEPSPWHSGWTYSIRHLMMSVSDHASEMNHFLHLIAPRSAKRHATRDTLHIYTCCTGCEVQIEQNGLTTPHRPSRGGGQPGTLSGQLITVISVLAFPRDGLR